MSNSIGIEAWNITMLDYIGIQNGLHNMLVQYQINAVISPIYPVSSQQLLQLWWTRVVHLSKKNWIVCMLRDENEINPTAIAENIASAAAHTSNDSTIPPFLIYISASQWSFCEHTHVTIYGENLTRTARCWWWWWWAKTSEPIGERVAGVALRWHNSCSHLCYRACRMYVY